MKLSIIGDVMLGRIIGSKYDKCPYDVVSKELKQDVVDSDFIIANLESPVVETADTEGDHLQFKGNPDVLDKLKWIDAFSLSNNHINDTGCVGMDETVAILERKGFKHNGLFKNEYKPLIIEQGGEKIALVTITDMMNIPFDEDCRWDVLRVGDERVMLIIEDLHNRGYCVLLYAHIGILFCRYPNPISYEYIHKCIDMGADIVVTAHSHCLGCFEMYKDRPIFHSLGDFVMDGNSFRRRRSGILKLNIEGGKVENWEIIPAEIDHNYVTSKPKEKVAKQMLESFEYVSKTLEKQKENYTTFFKNQYRKELFNHICSTIAYLVKSRGVSGMFKIVFKRFEEVGRMFSWMSRDRSKDQRDDDAIKADRKKFKQEDLF